MSISSLAKFGVGLYLNGDLIGSGYVEEDNTKANKSSFTIQSTLNLKKSDKVSVTIFSWSTGSQGRIWLTMATNQIKEISF